MRMPLLCEFLGMKIYMYYHDHYPPHFHVRGNYTAVVDFSGRVLAGHVPQNVISKLTVWMQLHKLELEENWQKAQEGQKLSHIQPLQ